MMSDKLVICLVYGLREGLQHVDKGGGDSQGDRSTRC